MSYEITEDCIGCGACAKKCPVGAIEGQLKVHFDIAPFLCDECGTCFEICPKAAILDPHGKRRPAGMKRKRLRARIDPEICTGCQTCYLNCPQEVIFYIKKGLLSGGYCRVDTESCVGCGTCTRFCITGAISLE